jgi:hypothetical protein
MTSLYLMIFALILIGEIGLLIYKIFKMIQKFEKLYDYFIRNEAELPEGKINFSSLMKGIPPTNGECPTKEELENFNK